MKELVTKVGSAKETFYLSPEALRSFADVRLISAEKEQFHINRSVLASQSRMLQEAIKHCGGSFSEQEEFITLVTDISSDHIVKILDCLVTGVAYPESEPVWASFEALNIRIPEFSKGMQEPFVKMDIKSENGEDEFGDIAVPEIDFYEGEDDDEDERSLNGYDENGDEYDSNNRVNSEEESKPSKRKRRTKAPRRRKKKRSKSEDEDEEEEDDDDDESEDDSEDEDEDEDSDASEIVQQQQKKRKKKKNPPASSYPRVPAKKYPCFHCTEVFDSFSLFRNHAQVAKIYQCPNCGQNFGTKHNVARHRSVLDPTHASDKCNYESCDYKYETFQDHQKHVDEVHGGKMLWKCGICGELFEDKVLGKIHRAKRGHSSYTVLKEDQVPGWKVCEECGYRSRASIKYHMQDNHGTEQIPCEQCPKIFKHPESLKRHIKQCHNQFPCDICGKMFKSLYTYMEHARQIHTHDDEKPFKCGYCGKGFARQSFYEEHLNKHTNEKPFKCRHCDKCFNSNSSRSSHENVIHFGKKRPAGKPPKPERCDECGKILRSKRHLFDHKITNHTPNDEKPIKCEICNLGFARQNYLDEHMNVHTGNTPFKCKFCGMAFKSSSTRYHHQNAVHRGIKRGSKKRNTKTNNGAAGPGAGPGQGGPAPPPGTPGGGGAGTPGPPHGGGPPGGVSPMT